jgi:hypothetical protein
MSKNVAKWIVEEVDALTGIKTTKEYDSYDDALDVYNDLKLKNEHNLISMEKSKKKLLLEG